VYNFSEIFLSKLPLVFGYGCQTFLISKLGVFYLKLKLFGSTSIAGGFLADTKKKIATRESGDSILFVV
jgi:hypothetical protein